MAQELFELAPAPLSKVTTSRCLWQVMMRRLKQTVIQLATEIGFQPIDCGELRHARLIESGGRSDARLIDDSAKDGINVRNSLRSMPYRLPKRNVSVDDKTQSSSEKIAFFCKNHPRVASFVLKQSAIATATAIKLVRPLNSRMNSDDSYQTRCSHFRCNRQNRISPRQSSVESESDRLELACCHSQT